MIVQGLIFDSALDNCFRKPGDLLPPGDARAVLFLLRRDLQELYGLESISASANHKAPMLAVLGMMAGLDLMAKLWSGDMKVDGGRNRFVGFLTGCGSLSPQDAEILYQYRNALAHSYGLYSVDKKSGKEFKFMLDDAADLPDFIKCETTDVYRIGFWKMKGFFLACATTFEAKLRNTATSDHARHWDNFHRVMDKIGYLKVGPST